MNCYQHRDQPAVGICKACQKAVCPTCAIDTGRGLACSEACVPEVDAYNQMMDKSKQIYGIGSHSKWPSTGILVYFLFALLFLGFGLYPWFVVGEVEWFSLIMGIGFVIIGIVVYVRTRSLKLNC